jgi:predicted ArsR family transcriptional regulator
MTFESKILRDLAAGRSTAGAIGQRFSIHPEAVAVILNRLQAEGKVIAATYGPLVVWSLSKTDPPTP